MKIGNNGLLGLFAALLLAFTTCKPHEVPNVEDYVVIGGGLMGSATAWNLANRGKKVILLEKQGETYTEGSSLGKARIARSSNRGNDLWSYLHNLSVAEVKLLISYLNDLENGVVYEMDDIYTTSAVTYVGRMTIYDKLLASLIRQRVEYKMATTQDEAALYFDMNLPDSVLIQREYNEYSGTINPEKLIEYTHAAIRSKKGEVRYSQKVTQLTKADDGTFVIGVETNAKKNDYVIHARNVVSAAGPYTGRLLKDVVPYFDTLIHPQRVFLAFLKITDDRYLQLSEEQKNKIFESYPVINSSTGTRKGSFFSMIEYLDEDAHPVIKIGGHFQRSNIDDLDQVWNKKLTKEELTWCIENTTRYFDMMKIPLDQKDIEVVDQYSCVYSLTDTEVPFVTHGMNQNGGKDNNLMILGGMSGVGGKGAMAYGKIAADMLLGTTENDSMYQIAVTELGYERLLGDLK